MSGQSIVERIKALIAPIIEAQQLELVDVEFHREGKTPVLRIFIDKPGGVTIDDCQQVSQECDVVLDVENLIQSQYVFEVSSPGLDRPLKRLQDFVRFQNRLVKIKTYQAIRGQKNFLGRLQEVQEKEDGSSAEVRLLLEETQEEIIIPYESISSARLEVEF